MSTTKKRRLPPPVRAPVPALCIALLGGLPAPAAAAVQDGDRPVQHVYAANIAGDNVTRHDAATGASLGEFVASGSGGLMRPTGLAFGPDGDLYVSSSGDDRILRFDGATGEFLAVAVDDDVLARPFSLAFGPDGMLYVSSIDRVLRYDITSGRFDGVAAEADELVQPIGLAFGADGALYVANSGGGSVMRFDAGGAPTGTFTSESLRYASDVALGPEGALYVSSAGTRSVLRFGADGSFEGVAMRLPERSAPVGIAFDAEGRLIVADFAGSRLFAATADPEAPRLLGSEGLRGPENIAIWPR